MFGKKKLKVVGFLVEMFFWSITGLRKIWQRAISTNHKHLLSLERERHWASSNNILHTVLWRPRQNWHRLSMTEMQSYMRMPTWLFLFSPSLSAAAVGSTFSLRTSPEGWVDFLAWPSMRCHEKKTIKETGQRGNKWRPNKTPRSYFLHSIPPPPPPPWHCKAYTGRLSPSMCRPGVFGLCPEGPWMQSLAKLCSCT